MWAGPPPDAIWPWPEAPYPAIRKVSHENVKLLAVRGANRPKRAVVVWCVATIDMLKNPAWYFLPEDENSSFLRFHSVRKMSSWQGLTGFGKGPALFSSRIRRTSHETCTGETVLVGVGYRFGVCFVPYRQCQRPK